MNDFVDKAFAFILITLSLCAIAITVIGILVILGVIPNASV